MGEVALMGEALVMDAGGTGDVAVLLPGADAAVVRRMVAELHAAAVRRVVAEPYAAAVPRVVAELHAAAVRRVVAEPHGAAVGQAGALALSAVHVAVSLFYVRPVAVRGEVAESARLVSSKHATIFPLKATGCTASSCPPKWSHRRP